MRWVGIIIAGTNLPLWEPLKYLLRRAVRTSSIILPSCKIINTILPKKSELSRRAIQLSVPSAALREAMSKDCDGDIFRNIAIVIH